MAHLQVAVLGEDIELAQRLPQAAGRVAPAQAALLVLARHDDTQLAF
jgi:hypothetical protein